MNIVAINKKQVIIFETKTVENKEFFIWNNNLTDLFDRLPKGTDLAISKEQMENEILRYALKNRDRFDFEKLINDKKTKFIEIKSLYELYMLVMLNG